MVVTSVNRYEFFFSSHFCFDYGVVYLSIPNWNAGCLKQIVSNDCEDASESRRKNEI